MTETEKRPKVMLVEDDASMLAVLSTLLEIEGYSVASAPLNLTLPLLLDAIRGTRPQVILLDVHLRNLNGLEVVRQIREDGQIRAARVVMCSGMDMRDACIANGADAFIMKPYMPDELLQKLKG